MFPGQGAQYVGMGKDFYEKSEASKKIFDKATELLGFDMTKLCFEENEDINITEYTQAALLTTSIASSIENALSSTKIRINSGITMDG